MDVKSALAWARAQGVDRLDAHLLLSHHLQRERAWLMAHDDDVLAPAVRSAFEHDVLRRADQMPLAYLTGYREFHGLQLQVGPAVLVPRPETELLVDWGLALLAACGAPEPPRVVDLGTGSGAIALAIKRAQPEAEVVASDRSADALAVASGNGARLGLDVRWRVGSWWSAHAGALFDLAVSNPPYVAGNDSHLVALKHEPRAALTPEGDGLAALREIIDDAPAHLRPGSWLLLEHGFDQGEAVRALLAGRGFEQIETRQDLAGLPRCSGGRVPNIGASR